MGLVAQVDFSELEFGKVMILPEGHARAPERALACFKAMPLLEQVSIWCGEAVGGFSDVAARAERDRARFWMRRRLPNADPLLGFSDVEDDRAAAACFRFHMAHDDLGHDLAVRYGYDETLSVVSFHRSGQAYFVRDAAWIIASKMMREPNFNKELLAPNIHPVFCVEPTGHDLMAWAGSVWSDLRGMRTSS